MKMRQKNNMKEEKRDDTKERYLRKRKKNGSKMKRKM